jgi:hypothetical protein
VTEFVSIIRGDCRIHSVIGLSEEKMAGDVVTVVLYFLSAKDSGVTNRNFRIFHFMIWLKDLSSNFSF